VADTDASIAAEVRVPTRSWLITLRVYRFAEPQSRVDQVLLVDCGVVAAERHRMERDRPWGGRGSGRG
jgi:hypothetical protein